MKLLILANNWLGWQVTQWLRDQGETIVGVVIHPEGRRTHADDIVRAAGVDEDAVVDGSRLREPPVLDQIAALCPDLGVSVLFNYIMRREFLELFQHGVINLHPSYLPYNRGQYPNVWSIVDGTPAGVTLHMVDEGIDTGAIIAQQEVDVDLADTGETLYRRLERSALQLVKDTWPDFRAGRISAAPQHQDNFGTYHRTRDVEGIDEIDLNRSYLGRDIINVLRARTFPPHRGAYIRDGQRKIYLRLELTPDEQLKEAT
jgi:methionyl-tRNA formyltransferase